MDRLGWATGLAFVAHGVRVGVRISSRGHTDLLSRFLPPGRRPVTDPRVDHLHSLLVGGPGPRPGVRRFHVVYSGGEVVARTHDLHEALEILEASIRMLVAIRARRRLFLHAGAVSIGGAGVVLPGASEAGKSTLVNALLAEGATYFSDEYAVLGAGGRLHPYPLDLRLQRGAAGAYARVSAAEAGARVASTSAGVGMVLLTRYRPGAKFRPRRLAPSDAVLKVLRHAIPARFRPAFTLDRLVELVRRTPVYASDRPDTRSVVDWLRERCPR